MYGWMIMYMSSQTSSAPEPSRLRRRVIVELTPEELPLLEAAERRHGTKRAAILAGLRAEATATATARGGRQGVRRDAALAEATRERDAARAEVASLEDRLARAEDARERDRKTHADEITVLTARIPEALYCARCDSWVPEERWSWTTGPEVDYVYHTDCGDHGAGVLAGASWLARWKHWEKPNR